MRRRLFLSALMTITIVLTSPQVGAQLVQVGPGYVKAPFVRVQRNPDGSKHVRAPFVNVHVPVDPSYGPGPYQTTHRSVSRYSYEQRLPFQAGYGAGGLTICETLRQDLSRLPTGSYWSRHLRISEVRKILSTYGDGPYPDAVTQQLSGILQNYEWTARSQDLSSISRLASFQALHKRLKSMVAPVTESQTQEKPGLVIESPETPREELRFPAEEIPAPKPN